MVENTVQKSELSEKAAIGSFYYFARKNTRAQNLSGLKCYDSRSTSLDLQKQKVNHITGTNVTVTFNYFQGGPSLSKKSI